MNTIKEQQEYIEKLELDLFIAREDAKKYEHRLDKVVKMSDRQQLSLIQLSEKYEEAKLEAQRANKAKSVFLSNMHHEIRTPMNAIQGFSDILFKGLVDPKFKSYAETIRSSSSTLMLLLNDILDLANDESSKIVIKKEKTDLSLLFLNIFNILELKAKEKSLNLELILDDSLPKSIMIDQLRYQEVAINLIANAIKFTDEGFVKVFLSATDIDKTSNTCNLELKVLDSGIGISKLDQTKVFNLFEQVDGQDEEKYEGSGLGLSIAKNLVKLMNGTINIVSETGAGSCFIVNLKDVGIIALNHTDKAQADKAGITDNETHSYYIEDIALFIDSLSKTQEAYQKALSTNCLNNIKTFAQILQDLASNHKVDCMVLYTQSILQKVDNFDIDAINHLLKEYEEKVKKLKNMENR